MFLNAVKYEIIQNFRTREVIVWMILFPVILGTLYKFTFGSIYEKEAFSPAKAAVVENEKDSMFHLIMDAVSGAEPPVMELTYCPEEEALALLQDGAVDGILTIDPPQRAESEEADASQADAVGALISEMIERYLKDGALPETGDESFDSYLTDFFSESDREALAEFVGMYSGGSFLPETELSLRIRRNGMQQTMLKKMGEMYQNMQKSGRDIMERGASGELQDGGKFADAMESEVTVVEEVSLTGGNTDPYATYMYNLIAMVAIFGSLAGLTIAYSHQANLSDVGARRACAGMPKLSSILASLIAFWISQILCAAFCVTFLAFVLRVDFGSRLPLVYLGAALGSVMGVSLGFFVGALGKLSYGAKTGILMALNMTMCFMSGLMMPGIKGLFVVHAPLVNALNPAAVVCDSFYYLSVDEDLSRFSGRLLAMVAFTAVFVLLGFVLTRRRKYASL